MPLKGFLGKLVIKSEGNRMFLGNSLTSPKSEAFFDNPQFELYCGLILKSQLKMVDKT